VTELYILSDCEYKVKMYGMNNIKFINARQAKEIYQYKNIKEKLHKTNAAIWYNKICKLQQFFNKCTSCCEYCVMSP
jgi:hypothetical protein